MLPHSEAALRGPGDRGLQLCASLLGAWTLVLAISLTLTLPLASGQPGWWTRLANFYAAGAITVCIWRSLFLAALGYLHRRGFQVKRVLIIGHAKLARQVHARTQDERWRRYHVVGVYFDSPETQGERVERGADRLVSLDGLPALIAHSRIDEVWIVLPLSTGKSLASLHGALSNVLVDVKVIPETCQLQTLSSQSVDLLGYTAIDLNRPAVSGMDALVKNVFDRIFAALALVLLSPLLLVIAVSVRLSSPGPIIFRQPRLGLNGKPFTVFKFRSMVVHQEAGTLTQASGNDPRVTRLGAFLRRTSLDELPQFFNVLMGDMSVVGPRPHALQHNELYQRKLADYMQRHRVKPGITGWAQINGLRGETETDEKMRKRVEFDLHYIKNWTLAFDLKIIVWTGLRGWTGNNAY